MKILILGGTGFIGNSIFHSLIADYTITIASRKPIECYDNWRKVDFSKENDWGKLLTDIDLVINAIGIIEGDFQKIQTEAPLHLFGACVKRNIRIINISAIGAEKKNPVTKFLQTKKVTDDFVLNYPLGKVIYPGIVLGKNGKSTNFFSAIARLPIIPIMNDKAIPLVHISQLTQLIRNIIEEFDKYPQQIFAVSESEKFTSFLSALKGKKARFFKIPKFCISLFFSLFPKATIGLFSKDTVKLFETTEPGDYKPIFEKASSEIQFDSTIDNSFLISSIALSAIVFIWVWSGISSIIAMDESYKLMGAITSNHQVSAILIFLGSFADIILGFAVLNKTIRKKVLILQLLFIVTYTLILTVFAPFYWIHPFGVLSKNIPIIALSFYLLLKNEA